MCACVCEFMFILDSILNITIIIYFFENQEEIKINQVDAEKSWKQGVVDDEGYFKLTHFSSQKVL